MNFERHQDPKVAMDIGVLKCHHCHKVIHSDTLECLCIRCYEKKYDLKHPKNTFWKRLTLFGQFLFMVLIGALFIFTLSENVFIGVIILPPLIFFLFIFDQGFKDVD